MNEKIYFKVIAYGNMWIKSFDSEGIMFTLNKDDAHKFSSMSLASNLAKNVRGKVIRYEVVEYIIDFEEMEDYS